MSNISNISNNNIGWNSNNDDDNDDNNMIK